MAVIMEISGLTEIVAAFRQAPSIAGPIFADAINATVSELHKNATDQLFMFKTPRSLRTGFLEKSFADEIILATPDSLIGSIGPRVEYANAVYTGQFARFSISPNPYMDRIVAASQRQADKFFQESIELFTKKITS